MNKLISKLSRGLVLAAVFLLPYAASASVEVIEQFNTDITVHSDGTFLVTETLEYNFGENNKHGIFRDIPLVHPQDASTWYKERYIDVEVMSVSRNGSPEPYVLNETPDNLNIKIGDANKTNAGLQNYEITYEVTGGYSYYENQPPELYWNVTGNDWRVMMRRARATVHDPEGLFIGQKACYRGYVGEVTSCTSFATTSAVTFTTDAVYPGQGMTIAQAFNTSLVEEVVLERVPVLYWLVPLVIAILFSVGVWAYRFATYHKPDLPVVAQYEPYPGLLPMFTGVVHDGILNPRDITAGILYLAQQGFIKIKHLEEKVLYFFEVEDYEIELLKDYYDAPTKFHTQILSLIFDLNNPGEKVKLGDLRKKRSKQIKNQAILNKLRQAVAQDVVERGFYEQVIKMGTLIIVLGVYMLGIFFAGPSVLVIIESFTGHLPGSGFFALMAIVIFVPLVVLGSIYRRRTRLGYEAKNHINGFKDFLTVTDKERFKFHNAPQKSPEQFMEYLPYAVALGVEKEWAEVFKDITIENPDWYDAGHSAAAFSAVDLATNLGGFSSSFSASSGSSGSSGGGSSGGGAGGGGGGSW